MIISDKCSSINSKKSKCFVVIKGAIMNLLITGAWKEGSKYIDEIQQEGYNVTFMSCEDDKIPCEKEWVQGCICNSLFLYHDIKAFPNLHYIQLTSAGYDRVPMKYVEENGITLNNAKGVYSIPMSEFVMGGVLCLIKKFDRFRELQKHQHWEKQRDLEELYGKNVLIVGCGNVGIACAERFKAFGCKVTGVSLHPKESCFFDIIVPLEMLNEKLLTSDIVVVSIALSDITRGLFNDERFKKIRDGAIFINISRGEVVEEKALFNHIVRLKGAILDVFETEPLREDSPLWKCENIMITPHNSFVGSGNEYRLARCIIRNLKTYKLAEVNKREEI